MLDAEAARRVSSARLPRAGYCPCTTATDLLNGRLSARRSVFRVQRTVNSISMKEGVEAFIHHAKLLRRYGAAVVVMAFDEQGQPTPASVKSKFCRRAYKNFHRRGVGFPPEDIIFDPNIFAVAVGTLLPELRAFIALRRHQTRAAARADLRRRV